MTYEFYNGFLNWFLPVNDVIWLKCFTRLVLKGYSLHLKNKMKQIYFGWNRHFANFDLAPLNLTHLFSMIFKFSRV